MNQLRRNFGFRNIDDIAPHLHSTTAKTFSISTKDKEPILDLDDTATIDKSQRNTTPLPLPTSTFDVVHMDIVFGSRVALGVLNTAFSLSTENIDTNTVTPSNL